MSLSQALCVLIPLPLMTSQVVCIHTALQTAHLMWPGLNLGAKSTGTVQLMGLDLIMGLGLRPSPCKGNII